MNEANKTALVTGANSGVGFEAAAQLAEDGWGKVILACRSIEKAEAAKAQLVERTAAGPGLVLVVVGLDLGVGGLRNLIEDLHLP